MLSHTKTQKTGPLRIWIVIFLMVTLQMSTTLRPIIGRSDQLLTTEKRFFLEHWTLQMFGEDTTEFGRDGRKGSGEASDRTRNEDENPYLDE